MPSFHVTVSDSVFPNLDPARQVLSSIGADLRMADAPTPEGIVAAAASSDALLVTYAKITAEMIQKMPPAQPASAVAPEPPEAPAVLPATAAPVEGEQK